MLINLLPTVRVGRSLLVEREALAGFLGRLEAADDPARVLTPLTSSFGPGCGCESGHARRSPFSRVLAGLRLARLITDIIGGYYGEAEMFIVRERAFT
jgi:hypothetical protein